MKRIKVIHIITGLSIGGAEKVLVRLLLSMDKDRFDNNVISLTDLGPLAAPLIENGIQVKALNFLKGSTNLVPLALLISELLAHKPDLVQTWMYHADLIGSIASLLSTRVPVMWNLRQSALDEIHSKKSTVTTAKICSRVSSSLPNTIVCGSEAARLVHTKMGYDTTKMVVIQNGFDTEQYKPSLEQHVAFRTKHNIPEDAIIIGNPSRYDPQKDHLTFLQAAARVVHEIPNARFLLCGENITSENQNLMSTIKSLGLSNHIHVLGSLPNVVPFYCAIDVLALSSAYGEGAPNVLGEAMSCQVPCVSTDVGDSAHIIGDTSLIVPPHNPESLANTLITLAKASQMSRQKISHAARLRIQTNFPLATMVQRYEDLYKRVYSQRYDF